VGEQPDALAVARDRWQLAQAAVLPLVALQHFQPALVLRDERQLGRLRKLPSVTRDGQRIGLLANVELPREAEMAMDAGAEGVGLLRTEFMFMNREDVP